MAELKITLVKSTIGAIPKAQENCTGFRLKRSLTALLLDLTMQLHLVWLTRLSIL